MAVLPPELRRDVKHSALYARAAQIDVVAEIDQVLSSGTREQLNEVARQMGIEAPESLANKKAVVAAIAALAPVDQNGGG